MPSKVDLNTPSSDEKKQQVRRRACSFVLHAGRVLMVRLKDAVSGYEFLVPPGGEIEPGETAQDAAVRETQEETGYNVKPRTALEPVTAVYDFEWMGRIFPCETKFVFCDLLDAKAEASEVHDAVYNLGTVWVPVDDVESVLAFHPQIQEAVMKCLRLQLN